MPIQNIDNYLMPNRSQEASIIRTNEVNKIPAEQRFLTKEVNEQADRKLTRTNETENVELREDGFDPRERSKNEYFISRKKKKKKKELADKMTETAGQTIDIKL